MFAKVRRDRRRLMTGKQKQEERKNYENRSEQLLHYEEKDGFKLKYLSS